MNITNVRIRPYEAKDNDNRLANVQVVLNDSLALYGIVIMRAVSEEGERLWLSMPARKLPETTADGEKRERAYSDYFHPISKEAREELTRVVLEHYEKVKADPEAGFTAPAAKELKVESVSMTYPKTDDPMPLAYAAVVLDNGMRLSQIRVVKKKDSDELSLMMPARKRAEGKYLEVFHPITAEFRAALTKAVLAEYKPDGAEV